MSVYGMDTDGDFEDLAKAVIERLRPTSGSVIAVAELAAFELYWWPNTKHVIPAMLCRPDPTKDRDYQGTLSGMTKWHMRLEFHVDALDSGGEAAHSEMSRLVSKRGPVISRLRDDEIHDALWHLCGTNIFATDGRGWKRNRRGRLQADIGLMLGAN